MLMDLLVNSDQFLCDEHHQKVHLIGPTLTGKYPIEITKLNYHSFQLCRFSEIKVKHSLFLVLGSAPL